MLVWAIGGVLALLGQAVWRLSGHAAQPWIDGSMTPAQITLCAAWTLFSLYAEGYRGFQRGFSPRVVTRAIHLADHPRALWVLLAPLYAMGLVHATRRRLAISWTFVLAIATVVVFMRRVPQPWRGIIDAGVVAGLVWGVVAILVFAVRRPDVDLELPTAHPPSDSAGTSRTADAPR